MLFIGTLENMEQLLKGCNLTTVRAYLDVGSVHNGWQVQVGIFVVIKFLWIFIGRLEDMEHWRRLRRLSG